MSNLEKELGFKIREKFINSISSREKSETVGFKPSSRFIVDSLPPKKNVKDINSIKSNISIRAKPDFNNFSIEISFNIFIPEIPTYKKFIEFSDKYHSLDKTNKNDMHILREGYYKKKKVKIKVKQDEISDLKYNNDEIDNFINRKIKSRINKIIDNKEMLPLYKSYLDKHFRNDVLFNEIDSNGKFKNLNKKSYINKFKSKIDKFNGDIIKNHINIEVNTSINKEKNDVNIILSNKSGDEVDEETPRFDEEILKIFNPEIKIISPDFEPYSYDGLDKSDYKYSKKVWCITNNVSQNVDLKNSFVKTDFLPTYYESNYKFKKKYNNDLNFRKLSNGNFDVLDNILESMKKFYDKWKNQEDDLTPTRGLSEKEKEVYKKQSDEFKNEIEKFRRGIKILRNSDKASEAFKLMNESNYILHGSWNDNFYGWRLFQIVYIVSNLDRVIESTENYEKDSVLELLNEKRLDETAEVLWFPTGGGKTEANTGIIQTQLFYDRLRGKEEGVSSWIRYPLRLLSQQQSSRILASIMSANKALEESENSKLKGTKNFELGIYVGSMDTENQIEYNSKKYPTEKVIKDDCNNLVQNNRVVDECPRCGSKTGLKINEDKKCLNTVCTGICESTLPVYIIDDDIYRFVPDVILGSLDRITLMGLSPQFRNLVGRPVGRCNEHGYVKMDNGPKCNICGSCDDKYTNYDYIKGKFEDLAPSLHIIDEVHMLNEELGALTSHYETFYLTMMEELHSKKPQVLCSTATVNESNDLMKNLFNLDASVFPVEGPVKGKNFYGEYDENSTDKIYTGITPTSNYSVSKLNSYIATIYESVIQDYRNDILKSDREFDINGNSYSSDKVLDALKMYETSICYFNSKSKKDTYLDKIRRNSNNYMSKFNGNNYDLVSSQITADADDYDISEYEDLTKDTDIEDYNDRIDTIAATSSISHGVDVKAFNSIIFDKQPISSAKYIQSSNRVGRSKELLGMVFTKYNRGNNLQSNRYRYFRKRHDHLNRMVQPTAIDRWSEDALKKTYPGILKSIYHLYQIPEVFYKMQEDMKKSEGFEMALDNGGTKILEEFDKDSYTHKMIKSYCCNSNHNEEFKDTIEEKTKYYFSKWNDNKSNTNWNNMLEDPGAMISLRDIGDTLAACPQQNIWGSRLIELLDDK